MPSYIYPSEGLNSSSCLTDDEKYPFDLNNENTSNNLQLTKDGEIIFPIDYLDY